MTNPTLLLAGLLAIVPSIQISSAEPEPSAAPDKSIKLNAETFSGMKLRNVGPALMSGRISDLAIDPVEPNTWFLAVGSGNLWKTTNAGTTWLPIFDKYGSYSIGCVTVDPINRNVIWVGTGENVGGRHVGFGDGVYKSMDGGGTFKNMGLKQSGHIAKILVDPRDSQVLYVAAQGPLWSAGGERGLYKSSNGGESWEILLAKGPYTGVTDIAMDPRNPDVLYAATHQRHRTAWALVNGGPESSLWKSTDAGHTWRELKQGLPGEDKGKIALAVSPLQPDVIYASIELAQRKGGFWRSTDRGESWTKMSDFISGGTGPHYYQEIFCDPFRFDVLYQADVQLARTEDGGKTWNSVEGRWKHVDNHAVAFHPKDPNFLLVGCDGGLYRSFDRGSTYEFFPNLPLTQFYKVDVDYEEPFYNIIGGTQDNATQHGPSRTSNLSGIRNSDWRVTIGGDGHDCAIDPQDPNVIYCESQQGFLRRYDRRTGESLPIRPIPEPGEEDLRFNWDSPILISPHSHTRIYYGSKKVHRSDDRGDSWTTLSPDLSRNLDRYKLKIMDRVWSIDATFDTVAMSQYGNVTSISESRLQEGLLYAGTDDGLLHVTENAGKHWRRIERIYGVPELAFVNDIKADWHDTNAVYAAFDNHKEGDLKPYLVKSPDRGLTWSSMTGDLPSRHLIWRLIQDHVNPNLFFLGTELGLFFTLNGGTNWIKLTGQVPTISFRDLEIQRRENDLVAASFGRSFFILDDYTPLRQITQATLNDHELVLFPVRRAWLHAVATPLGGEKGSQGDTLFTAPNPPYGALITYHLKESLKTRKQQRQDQEAKTKKAGGDNPYPGYDALRKEDREESPGIFLTLRDSQDRIVRRLSGPGGAGFHRVAWDLRYGGFTASQETGPYVLPGTYSVSVEKRVEDALTPLGQPQSFTVVAAGNPALSPQDPKESLAFFTKAGDFLRLVQAAVEKIREAKSQLNTLKTALRQSSKATPALVDATRQLELKLMQYEETLSGDSTKRRYNEPTLPSISERLSYALGGSRGLQGPTQTMRRSYDIATKAYQELHPKLHQSLVTELAALQAELDKAGIPWTPGRPLPPLN